jgi:hypothetical protein
MPNLFYVPILTRRRIWAAFLVAIVADAMQMLLGPLGWLFLDQGLDVIAMILTIALVGFHPLLLPTFLLELVPVVDMLPTWTASVALVVVLRHKQTLARENTVMPPPPGVIDI